MALLACGCASDHRVSPWGAEGVRALAAFAERPDLAAQLAVIDRETHELGLSLEDEIEGKLARGEGPAVARAYVGADPFGQRIHAVRVATGRGVVVALGPPDPLRHRASGPGAPAESAAPLDRSGSERRATELVRSIGQGMLGRPLSDMNGDHLPDLLLRDEEGTLAIRRVDAMGSTALPIVMVAPPDRAFDLGGDGRIDFGGTIGVPEGDPIAPVLDDVASWDGARFTDDGEVPRAYHRARAVALAPEPPGEGGGAAAPPAVAPEVRLRKAIERAFHEVLAGTGRPAALARLDEEAVPPALRASFERWVRVVESVAPGPSGRGSR